MKFAYPILVLAFVASACAKEATFDNHKVVRMFPKNAQQLLFLQQLQENDVELDFWQDPSRIGRSVDLRLSPAQADEYMQTFENIGLAPETFIEDVQVLINNEKRNRGEHRWTNWEEYEEFSAIEGWLAEQAAAYEFVTLTDIGDTSEGRDVWMLTISRNPSAEHTLWLDCNIHAREWITSATCTWMINELLTNSDYDSYLENWNFYIVPVLNADGFVYSHTDFRLWRKTRTDRGESCIGVDGNRNWDFHWGETGASGDPCSDVYYGPSPFSEPSNQAASAQIESLASSITLHLTFHSYSQLILVPWGWTTEVPDDYDELMAVGLAGEQAIESAGLGDGIWETDTPPNLLYVVSGDHSDWAKGAAGIKYSYTFELRDRGQFGFILPAEQIIPAAQETLIGTIAMMDAVINSE